MKEINSIHADNKGNLDFHSAHPAGWAEYVCMYVCVYVSHHFKDDE